MDQEQAENLSPEARSRPDTYFVVSNPHPSEANGISVLFAGRSQTKPGHQVGPKVVDYYLVHHVLQGNGEFTCRGETFELSAGDSFIIVPGELVRYAADPDDPWQYRWVAFRGERSPALLADAGIAPGCPVVRMGCRSRRPPAMIRAIELAFRRGRSAASLEAAGYLQLLLASYAGASAQGSSSGDGRQPEIEATVRRAIEYLSTQYAEAVSIELMAETLGYNRAYLSKLFKRETGLTPVTFLLRLRLDKARRLLRERLDLTTGQIAASVGFLDALYFSKQFRKYYGQSPSEYRTETRSF